MVVKKFIFFALSSVLFFHFNYANAGLLQEAWFKVIAGEKHIGYMVHRYEFDESKKQMIGTRLLRTSAIGGDIIESLTAKATEKLVPISYQYTYQQGKTQKVIDASFSNGKATYRIVENGKSKTESMNYKKGTFLSTFLVYLLMQKKTGGLKVDKGYDFIAIAEEDGKDYKGEVHILSKEKHRGIETYQIKTSFKGSRSISFVTPIGAVVTVVDPYSKVQYTVAMTKSEAEGSIPKSDSLLTPLFGNIPQTKSLTEIEPAQPINSSTNSPINSNSKSKSVVQKEEVKINNPPPAIPKGVSVPPGKGLNKKSKKGQ